MSEAIQHEAPASAPRRGRKTAAEMTAAQRDVCVRSSLTRFVRNRSLPSELEDLRHKLIVARVMQGMLAVEAAEKFGYANSTQLSLIESGERPTPRDWRFLKQAAEVYSVSIDWLLGLSPTMEPDSRVAHQYALLRGTESIMAGFVTQITTAMIQTASETQPLAKELERVVSAVDEHIARFSTLIAQEAFEDLPGGAPVVATAQRLERSLEPLRAKLKKFKGLESYMAEVRAGTLPVIPYLCERYEHDQETQ
ncbi:helix-turn-helix transcriptional regulator [Paraburkholderia sp. J63]|uniref:helix-turn-helix transcriptional regulator n=1 Tax=Paraburkholderia sp. J63 TaxID=2805434 RepID=UPI002ABD7193|nr:helix-turn-helix transcriptional regulator [Paraburkholderia sp. J63]